MKQKILQYPKAVGGVLLMLVYPLVPPEPLPHGLDPLQLTCK